MKRIYYFITLITVVAAFSACNPLDKTYKQLGDIPKPATAVPPPTSTTITLSAADYGLLPSTNYAKTTLAFKTSDDAKAGISAILSAKYPTASDKSSALVSYSVTPPAALKPADSVFTHVAYTFLPADYTVNGGVNTYTNFSAAQVITWLGIKYPTGTAVANQLAVLTFNYYESGVASIVTQSFMYLNGTWTKIYHVTAAQYASVAKGGTNNDFASADVDLLPTYFNIFLKADNAVMVTAKFGDVKYVSYKYYGGSTANTFQRVYSLVFNGTNWVATPIPATAPIVFLKTNGVWVADNTVNYTFVQADYNIIAASTVGTAGGRTSIGKYPDFNISATSDVDYWSDDDIKKGIIVVLQSKYGSTAVKDQKFIITYTQYSFGKTSNVPKTFQYDGTAFVFVQ